jgi:hypothetical protein
MDFKQTFSTADQPSRDSSARAAASEKPSTFFESVSPPGGNTIALFKNRSRALRLPDPSGTQALRGNEIHLQ